MIIVDGDEEDAKVDEIVQDVDAWIQGQNGQIAKTDKWGKRKFAYEINHKTEGHYVVLEMTTGQIDMEPLERQLRLLMKLFDTNLFAFQNRKRFGED